MAAMCDLQKWCQFAFSFSPNRDAQLDPNPERLATFPAACEEATRTNLRLGLTSLA